MTMHVLRRLFGFKGRVDRSFYLAAGVSLMIAKYAVDALVIWLVTGVIWTPTDYLVPLIDVRGDKTALFPLWLSLGLIAWTLPFIWIGASMTLRRAVDAGHPPWWVLGFFAPLLNYAVMLWLAIAPRREHEEPGGGGAVPFPEDRVRSALTGVVGSILLGVVGVLVTVFLLDSYGIAVFILIPFAVGLVSAYAFNARRLRASGETAAVSLTALLILSATLVLFAIEGVICVAMAIPLAVPIALFGGILGREVASRFARPSLGAASCLLLFPIAWFSDASAPDATVYMVTTAVEIDAPPEVVWDNVVAFNEIEERPQWWFRLGIAYPVRARIEGEGVGAVRYCEFSTGAFVEPITHWSPPYHLAFDVESQPAALQELSPYGDISAPHLREFFRSTKGEFRLVRLEGGRTRLEGTTWYELHIYPLLYWRPLSEWLVARIHERVLRQIERDAITPQDSAT